MITFLIGMGFGLAAAIGALKAISDIKRDSFQHGYTKAQRDMRGGFYSANRYLDVETEPKRNDMDLVFKDGSVVDEDGTVLAAVGAVRV